MQKSLLLSVIMLLVVFNNVVAQRRPTNDDPLSEALARLKSTLVQHYKPRIMVQNRSPAIDGRFVPIEFDSCNLKWKIVARSGGLTYITQQSLDLADLDPQPPFVLMEHMPRTDRWVFELRTTNEERKIKGDWIVSSGSRIIARRQFWLSRTGLGADSQEVARQIADQVISIIKPCAQRRAARAPGADSP
jgi:hypothetical protein